MKDTRYFTHDEGAAHDDKTRALIKKYGMKGYGMFWIIIENLRRDGRYRLKEKKYVWESLADQTLTSVDEIKKFIKDCIDEFELFVQSDGFFYSESLIERMAKLEAIRDKNRTAAYIMHSKYGHNITKDGKTPED